MRRKVEKNATTLARRFRNLAGLKLLLSDELRALEKAKRKAVSMLDDISEACTHRPQTLVEQVALSFSPSATFVTQQAGDYSSVHAAVLPGPKRYVPLSLCDSSSHHIHRGPSSRILLCSMTRQPEGHA